MKTLLAGLAASLALSFAPAAQAAQLLVNGGFESGLSGWTVTAPWFTSVVSDPGAPADHLVRLGGPSWNKASISQSFTTDAGDMYDVSFSGGLFGTGGARQINVFMDNAWVAAFNLAPAANSAAFSTFGWSFMGTGGSQNIQFEIVTASNSATILDDISIVERVIAPDPTSWVPEPSTWAMMILGFGAIGAVVRRRARTAA